MSIMKIVFGLLVALCFCWGTAHADSHRVLVVHSLSPGFAWVQGINTAIKASFDRSGIEYQFFYMNTYENSGVELKEKICAHARKVLKRFKPQVVIAVDDDAQRYFVQPYVGKSPIQFVFCGVNAESETYGYPADNVTGILERTYPAQALELLKKIMPDVATSVALSDESSTSNLVMQRLKGRATDGSFPIQLVGFEQLSTFSQWVTTVKNYEKSVGIDSFLIPIIDTIKQDWDQQNMSPAEMMMWTTDNVTKPIVGLWPSVTDHGALCAVVVDPKEHGKVAALMAKKILSGQKAGQIPMVTNQDGYVIVNLKTAAKLNINVPFSVLQSTDKIIE